MSNRQSKPAHAKTTKGKPHVPLHRTTAPKNKTWKPYEIIADAKAALRAKSGEKPEGSDLDPKLLAAIQNDKVPIPDDKLDQIRSQCRTMRDLALEIKEAEAVVANKKKEFTKLQTVTLPELFAENNIPSITLGAEGNHPEIVLENKPFYKAVLPKESDKGLRWLESKGHGDLIKRVFTVKLPRNSAKAADQLRKLVQKLDLAYEEDETVPWTTLTAFVKEMIEKRKKAVPLDILGAIIGRTIKMKVNKSED